MQSEWSIPWTPIAVLGGAILSVTIGAIWSSRTPDPVVGEAVSTAVPPALQVSIDELVSAYDANEVAAQRKYGGAILEVTGKVDSISLDYEDKPFVTFASEAVIPPVQAKFTDAGGEATADLVKGQDVALRCGGVSEMMGTPMLSGCEITGSEARN